VKAEEGRASGRVEVQVSRGPKGEGESDTKSKSVGESSRRRIAAAMILLWLVDKNEDESRARRT
jgi:hypothetical protein